MNSRALGRTSIPLVAIVMIGAMMIVSVIPAYSQALEGFCPPGVGFASTLISSITDTTLQAKATAIDAADGVEDGIVCVKTFIDKGKAGKTHTVIVDNNFPL